MESRERARKRQWKIGAGKERTERNERRKKQNGEKEMLGRKLGASIGRDGTSMCLMDPQLVLYYTDFSYILFY